MTAGDRFTFGGRVETLDREELASIARWHRRLQLGLALGVVLLGVWLVILAFGPDEPWVRLLAVPLAGPLVATGLAIQLPMRCPRCSEPIRVGRLLALPARCPRCGVELSAAGRAVGT